jgi:hypothetical protein
VQAVPARPSDLTDAYLLFVLDTDLMPHRSQNALH